VMLMTDQNASSQLAILADLDNHFQLQQIPYWLFGGWAVDFHVGRITRAHGDLDIAVWWADRDRLAVLLASRQWVHRPDADEDGYTCYERNGIRLEIAFIARDPDGIVYTPLVNGRADWPLTAFGNDVRRLLGVQARVVSREALIADKSVVRDDSVTDTKDRADLLSLDRQT
jgi:Aminoglycoside-2''-adenylyltransferase